MSASAQEIGDSLKQLDGVSALLQTGSCDGRESVLASAHRMFLSGNKRHGLHRTLTLISATAPSSPIRLACLFREPCDIPCFRQYSVRFNPLRSTLPQKPPSLRNCNGDEWNAMVVRMSCSCIRSSTQSKSAKGCTCPKQHRYADLIHGKIAQIIGPNRQNSW